eukprot:tig00020537_g10274.t1
MLGSYASASSGYGGTQQYASPERATRVPVQDFGLGPRRSFGIGTAMQPQGEAYIDPLSPRAHVGYAPVGGGELDSLNSSATSVQALRAQFQSGGTASRFKPAPPAGPPPAGATGSFRPPPPPGPPPVGRGAPSPPPNAGLLLEAARRGDAEEVAELLERGVDVRSAPADEATRRTVLHYAAEDAEMLELVRRCCQQAPAMANAADASGETPLMLAAYAGRAEAVKALLAARANPEARDASGESALHAAGAAGAGAAVNAISNQRRSPLHLAASAGAVSTLGVLLQAGADPTLTDADGTTASCSAPAPAAPAASRPSSPRTTGTSTTGTGPTARPSCTRSSAASSRPPASSSNAAPPRRRRPEASAVPPLAAAAARLDTAACALLLSRGAPVAGVRRAREAREAKTGRTLLMAIAQADDPVLEPLAAELVGAGAEVNARDAEGRTALMYCARNGNRRLAALLASRSADVNAQDRRGMTALMWASLYPGAEGVVEQLVDEARAETGVQDAGGWTALHYACFKGRTDVARALRAAAADPHVKDRNNLSAVQWAAWRGHWDCAEAASDEGEADAALLALAPASGRETRAAGSGAHLERMVEYFVAGEARPKEPFGARAPFAALAGGSEEGVLAALLFARAFREKAERAAGRGAGPGRAEDPAKLEQCADECLALSHAIIEGVAESAHPDRVQAAVAKQLGVDGRGAPAVSPCPIDLARELDASKLLAHDAVRRLVDRLWDRGCSSWTATLSSLVVRPYGTPLNLCDGSAGSFFAAPRGKFCLELLFYLAFVAIYTRVLMLPTVDLRPREFLLLLWFLAFVQYEAGQLLDEGRAYFRSPWNLLDCALAATFLLSFALRFLAATRGDHDQAMLAFDILACNGVLLYVRLVRVFELHSRLGPLVQIVGGMFSDVATFAVLFAVVACGFVVTLHGVAGTVVDGAPTPISGTAGVVLRAALGDVDFGAFDAAAPVAGQLLLALWALVSVILLLNLLIAIFTGTYEAVASRSQEAYRARFAHTVLAFNKDTLFVPPPLNLLRALIDTPFLCWRLADSRRSYPSSTPGLAITTLLVLLLLAPFSLLYFLLRPGPALAAFSAVKAARARKEAGGGRPGAYARFGEEEGEEEGEDGELLGEEAPFFAAELPSGAGSAAGKEAALGPLVERVEALPAALRAAVHEAVQRALAPYFGNPAPRH